jgi:hypothetical protein
MRAVGMIDRRQKPPRGKFLGQVDCPFQARHFDERREAEVARDRRRGKAARIAEACDKSRLAVASRDQPTDTILRAMLEQREHLDLSENE